MRPNSPTPNDVVKVDEEVFVTRVKPSQQIKAPEQKAGKKNQAEAGEHKASETLGTATYYQNGEAKETIPKPRSMSLGINSKPP